MFNEFDEVTRNEALRAVTASSRDHDGRQCIAGTIGTLSTLWALPAAQAMIRAGAGVNRIFWDATAGGLVLVDHTDTVMYRFTTTNPFDLPVPGPGADAAPPRRVGLRTVRPAS